MPPSGALVDCCALRQPGLDERKPTRARGPASTLTNTSGGHVPPAPAAWRRHAGGSLCARCGLAEQQAGRVPPRYLDCQPVPFVPLPAAGHSAVPITPSAPGGNPSVCSYALVFASSRQARPLPANGEDVFFARSPAGAPPGPSQPRRGSARPRCWATWISLFGQGAGGSFRRSPPCCPPAAGGRPLVIGSVRALRSLVLPPAARIVARCSG